MQASSAAHQRLRTIAALVAAGLAFVFAALAWHELVNCKPYKIVGPPLGGRLALLGRLLLIALPAAALATSALGRRLVSLIPVVSTALVLAVTLAGFSLVMLRGGGAVPVDGDLGTSSVWSSFQHFFVQCGLATFGVAVLASVIIRVLPARLSVAV